MVTCLMLAWGAGQTCQLKLEAKLVSLGDSNLGCVELIWFLDCDLSSYTLLLLYFMGIRSTIQTKAFFVP